MNYKETIQFLFNSLPMYQRQGKAAYKANLDNTLKLDEYLDHPHRSFATIHVAGTNGKGSVSHMLASVLQQSGLKTGLYTSPHLLDFRERIRIDGAPIPESEVVAFVSSHREIIEKLSPSFFEMTVAMAFDHFHRQQVDVAVIETGMGGRLDSTNIVLPVLTIITNISLDHTEFLGNDVASIAREKGGIIKKGVPLIIGRAESPAEEVLTGMAEKNYSRAVTASRLYETMFHTYDRQGHMHVRIREIAQDAQEKPPVQTFVCDLGARYQIENIITLLAATKELQRLGWKLSQEDIREGLGQVKKNTGIMGRWQILGHNPRSICDTAHNPDGIAAVMQQIDQIPRKRLHMVWGMVSDKDLDAILPLLPEEALYYFTPSSVPRSMDAKLLCRRAGEFGLRGKAWPGVQEAYLAARLAAGPDDFIFTGGSTFVVADLLEMKK
jgi:dihydrofolate synthase/folylpolyglutamate synthase